jgi:hypothetical protein
MEHLQSLKLQGNIVDTRVIGGTTLHICSDYFATTPDEVEKVLDNLHRAAWEVISRIHREGGEV